MSRRKVSRARQIHEVGYAVRTMAIAAPLIKEATPVIKAAADGIRRKRNARNLTKWLNQPTVTEPKTVKIIRHEPIRETK